MTNRELEEYNKNRKIWQVCAITSDLERTMQQWVDKLRSAPGKSGALTTRTWTGCMWAAKRLKSLGRCA